jgi:Bacterial DNA-binding protein
MSIVVFDTIASELAPGQDVAVAGFGNFSVAERAARDGRNPATGAGMFSAEVAREGALAAMIAVYLAELTDVVQIAPPILAVMSRGGRNQARLAPLERTWTLPATEAVGVRS